MYDSFINNGSYKTDHSCVDKKGEGGVFLWGDSHVEALSYGLRTLLAEQDIPVYQKTSAGCRASLKDTTRQSVIFKKSCDLSNDLALASIDKLNPTLVIVAQANGHEIQDWQAISDKISTISDAKLIVVGPVSQWQPSLPSVMVKSTHWKQNEKIIHDNGLDLKIMNMEKIMLNRNQKDSYKYISLIKNLCEQNENDQQYYCRVRTNKSALLQIDYSHLSKAGSVYIARNILIEPILRLYRQ